LVDAPQRRLIKRIFGGSEDGPDRIRTCDLRFRRPIGGVS